MKSSKLACIALVIFFTLLAVNCAPKEIKTPEDVQGKADVSAVEKNEVINETDDAESVVGSEDAVGQVKVDGWPEYIPFMAGTVVVENTVSAEGNPSLNLELTGIPDDIRDYYTKELVQRGWVEVPSRFSTRNPDGFRAAFEREGETLQLVSRAISTGTQLVMILIPSEKE